MKIYVRNHNHALTEIAKHFEITGDIKEADRVVLWTDTDPIMRGIITLARQYNKPVIVVQHGRRSSSRYFPPFNLKILADRYCCWGSKDKEDLVKMGNDPEKIFITGNTILKRASKGKVGHEGINIVFSPEHWDKEVSENATVARKLRAIAKKHNFKIITKIIEGHNEKTYDNPIRTNRKDSNHLDVCGDVLSTADLVVCISESTFELIAQFNHIPVIVADVWKPKAFLGDERYKHYKREYSRACKLSKLKNLEETILDQLLHHYELGTQRMEVLEEEGGINIINPEQKIVDVIKG